MSKNEGAPRRTGKQDIVDKPDREVHADKEVKDGAAKSDDEDTGAATLQNIP